jgi:ATP-dependent Clp protease ATP-binding subunit ClpA
MFERFTERARQVVVLAQEEARILKHNYIGTEHILLGLLREEEGLAARVLESLGITVEHVRAQVVRIVGAGEETSSGQIPFTPRAKKTMELALRESQALAHNYIGTEHLLLGLLREADGVAAAVLRELAGHPELVQDRLNEALGSPESLPDLGRSLPLTSSATDLLKLAQAEAEARGDARVGTKHILLALTRQSRGSIRNLDAESQEIREELRGLVSDEDRDEGPEPSPRG